MASDEVEIGSAGVPVWPLSTIDSGVGLATAIHAAPRTYAALLGSGISRPAGIPTGWEVVQDLIQLIGAAAGVTDPRIATKPEAWWREQTDSEPRYDELLAAAAPTDAGRQALLRGYFDPLPGVASPVQPTAAHFALARLVASGWINVIVTTNFDRLTERALDAVGVSPQVIAQPSAVNGMIPLQHCPATVIKLHGDYATLPLRNTPAELSRYPRPWRTLLRKIFDEYGLMIVGWSGEHDIALTTELTRSANHRYPTFWSARGSGVGDSARRIIAQRRAVVVPVADADHLFAGLETRLERLIKRARLSDDKIRYRSIFHLPPDRTHQGSGWAEPPLLALRVSATYEPVTEQTFGTMGGADRARIAAALDAAPVTCRVRTLADLTTPASSTISEFGLPANATAEPLTGWEIPPECRLSTMEVTFRLGGDSRAGVSALLAVRGPSPFAGNAISMTLDIGISVHEKISLATVIEMFRDGLTLLANDIPDALEAILPPEARAHRYGLMLNIETADVAGNHRTNELPHRLDLTGCGTPPLPAIGLIGLSFDAPDEIETNRAVRIVIDAMNRMLLDKGYGQAEEIIHRISIEINSSE